MRLFAASLAILLSLGTYSQEETRLALVIGNANYTEGELKNPVNDALLVAQTLDSLDFDVILDTNLTDILSFVKSIRNFGTQRRTYDIGLVYYAGHGIQVDGEDFLLPTKQIFTVKAEQGGEIFEEDIKRYAVNVNEILKHLTSESGAVNILILDACRNSPLKSRDELSRGNLFSSQDIEDELARNPPPSGSLIAYSTDPGRRAFDGKGANSIYCESLCNHMLKEGLTIEQVFKRVRLDVETITQNQQSPVEAQKMKGDDFYLVKSDFQEEYDLAKKLQEEGEVYSAMQIITSIITKEPTLKAYENRAFLYQEIEIYDKAIEDYRKCLEIDSLHISAYKYIGLIYENNEEYNAAIDVYNDYLEIEPNEPLITLRISDLYSTLNEYDKSLEYLNNYLSIQPDDVEANIKKALFHAFVFDDLDKALETFVTYEKTNPIKKCDVSFPRAGILREFGYFDQAIEVLLDCGWDVTDDENYSWKKLNLLGECYYELGFTDKAIMTISKGIELDINNPNIYECRGNMYLKTKDYDLALHDFLKCIELNPESEDYGIYYKIIKLYDVIGDGHHDLSLDYANKAIAYFDIILGIEPALLKNSDIYEIIASCYSKKEEWGQAIKWYSWMIENVDENSWTSYYGRYWSYLQIHEHEKALSDLDKCLELFPSDGARYYNMKGEIYWILGEIDKSNECFDACLDIDPKYSEVILHFITSQVTIELLSGSKVEESYLRTLVQNTYKYIELYKSRTVGLLNDGLVGFNEAYILSEAYMKIVFFLRELGDFEEAGQVCHEIINLHKKGENDTQCEMAAAFLVELYINHEELDLALKYCNFYLTLSDDNFPYMQKAQILYKQNRYLDSFFELSFIIRMFKAAEDMGLDLEEGIKAKWPVDPKNRITYSASEVFIMRGDLLREKRTECLNSNNLICEDYEKACELGDCEAYNKYCH